MESPWGAARSDAFPLPEPPTAPVRCLSEQAVERRRERCLDGRERSRRDLEQRRMPIASGIRWVTAQLQFRASIGFPRIALRFTALRVGVCRSAIRERGISRSLAHSSELLSD